MITPALGGGIKLKVEVCGRAVRASARCLECAAALRAAVTKTSRFPLKETVFAVKNTPNFRGASRRFDRGVFIRSKDLAQSLVGGFLFLPEISGKVTGGVLRRGGFNSIPSVSSLT